MRKNSTSYGDETKKIFCETSRGFYVVSDDDIALSNHLVHIPSHNYGIVDISVEEELN